MGGGGEGRDGNECVITDNNSTCINHASLSQNIRILCQNGGVDDPPFVFGLLEVRVGEEEEDLGQLALLKVVREILHGIGS